MNQNDNKILLLISTLGGGGAEGVCVNIANGLADQGWNVDLVVLNLKNAVYHERLSKNVNLKTLEVSQARYAFFPLLKMLFKIRSLKILVFDFELTLILVLLRELFKIKIKIISRNINTLSKTREINKNFIQKKFLLPIFDYFFCRVDHVINQCNAMREDLISLYPNLDHKSSVIYNPVARHFEDYAAKNNLANIKKKNYLLCVGRLEKQKAFQYAIQAFAVISKEFPEIRLKIVGYGSMKNELKRIACELDILDRIDFEGFQNDMTSYYVYARATILTSIYEGYPNVLVESIMLNTPVVAFDCKSGPNEIIQEKVNGFLVNYKDTSDLINKLRMSLISEYDSKKMEESIRKNTISEVINEYSKCLSQFH